MYYREEIMVKQQELCIIIHWGLFYGLSAAVFYTGVIIMNKFIKGSAYWKHRVHTASLVLLPYVMATDGLISAE